MAIKQYDIGDEMKLLFNVEKPQNSSFDPWMLGDGWHKLSWKKFVLLKYIPRHDTPPEYGSADLLDQYVKHICSNL